jgi:hypothetical protein
VEVAVVQVAGLERMQEQVVAVHRQVAVVG